MRPITILQEALNSPRHLLAVIIGLRIVMAAILAIGKVALVRQKT